VGKDRRCAGKAVNRRAPRVFMSARKATRMTTQSPDAAASVPAAASRPQSRNWRGRGQLKLIGARKGDGTLVWSGRAIPATYELDVFSQGDVRSVQGKLDGDFSDLVDSDEDGGSARLRLDDGREIDIDVVDLEPWGADFEAKGGDALRTLAPFRFESAPA